MLPGFYCLKQGGTGFHLGQNCVVSSRSQWQFPSHVSGLLATYTHVAILFALWTHKHGFIDY